MKVFILSQGIFHEGSTVQKVFERKELAVAELRRLADKNSKVNEEGTEAEYGCQYLEVTEHEVITGDSVHHWQCLDCSKIFFTEVGNCPSCFGQYVQPVLESDMESKNERSN